MKSHLDEAGLKAIAAATGGAYVHLGGQGEDFEAFLRTVFGAVSKHDLIYRQQKIYNERYQWPLAASLVMLLASLVVGTRRSSRRRAAAVSHAVALSAVVGVLIIPSRSESADQADAPTGTIDSKAPVVEYNAGTSAYRAGQFPQATQAFQKSIKVAPASDAKRLADQEDAYYNLGNALYRAGQQFEKSAPQEAIQKWTEAVKAYDTALQLRADDADSKYNRDFVKRKIDALRQPPNQGGEGAVVKAKAAVRDKVRARDNRHPKDNLPRANPHKGNPRRANPHKANPRRANHHGSRMRRMVLRRPVNLRAHRRMPHRPRRTHPVRARARRGMTLKIGWRIISASLDR